jgi:hypothetical protein
MGRCIVVDAMHNLFLGLIKEHFDGILGIRLSKAEEAPALEVEFSALWKEFTPQEQKSVSKLKKLLQRPLVSELDQSRRQVEKKFMRFHSRALEFACTELKCPVAPANPRPSRHRTSKTEWAHALLAWVRGMPAFDLPSSPCSGSVNLNLKSWHLGPTRQPPTATC